MNVLCSLALRDRLQECKHTALKQLERAVFAESKLTYLADTQSFMEAKAAFLSHIKHKLMADVKWMQDAQKKAEVNAALAILSKVAMIPVRNVTDLYHMIPAGKHDEELNMIAATLAYFKVSTVAAGQ